jgi:molybdenum cofactor cytidylyltransferase
MLLEWALKFMKGSFVENCKRLLLKGDTAGVLLLRISMKIHMILLAAGFGKRFGGNKLLYELDGKPMYRHIAERLLEIYREQERVFSFTAVTQYEEIRRGLEALGVQVAWNPCSEKGISSSIRVGLEALDRGAETEYYAFFVGDQPYLKRESIEDFFHGFSFQEKGIGCMAWNGTPGNPVIFHERYREELLALSGDVGGRKVMQGHPEDIFYFNIADKKELQDVDQKKSDAKHQGE